MVAFMNLLPHGPIWDYWKRAAISYFENPEADPAKCPLLKDPKCPSLVLHSIYVVLKLQHYVHNALWVAQRESHPTTAVTTIDNHLSRLQWEDCYAQHCRSVLLGDITPYEVIGDCGPIFCEPDFPEELKCALKRNIAISLTRANRGIIKNLCSINWVIEPLGARLQPLKPISPDPAERATFNPTDSGPSILLSPDALTITSTEAGAGSDEISKSYIPRASGKRYFEMRIDSRTGVETIGIGIADTNVPIDGERLGLKGAIGIYDDGYAYINYGSGGTRKLTSLRFGPSEWVGVAVDLTAGKIWFRDLTGWDGDPGTDFDPTFTFTPNTFYAAASLRRETDRLTANFGSNAFVYPPPPNFLGWSLGRCDSLCSPSMELEIFPFQDWLEGCWSGDVCDTLSPLPKVSAKWDRGCDKPAGLPDTIWPGILAAECIVRSMLPETCPNIVVRRCEVIET